MAGGRDRADRVDARRRPTSFNSSAAAAPTSCRSPGSASRSPSPRRRPSTWATTCTSASSCARTTRRCRRQAVFSNVRIVVPPKAGWTPYRDYIGSNLEIMTVATGARTVLHTSPISLAGAELDHRRQGADLQQHRQALSLRPGDARRHRDEHRLCDAQQQRPRAVVRRDDDGHQPPQRRRQRPLGDLHAAVDRRHAEAHHRQLAVVLPQLVARQASG